MKEVAKQKSGFGGSGDGESASWFWTILEWLLSSSDEEDAQVSIDSAGGRQLRPALARVLQILGENV